MTGTQFMEKEKESATYNINKEDFKRLNLTEVKTTINLGKIEFGIYINSTKFKELNDLIKLIKEYF